MDKHKDPVINRVHALTNANNCTKYEQDPGKIVLFHNIFFSSGEQPEQRIAAHKL